MSGRGVIVEYSSIPLEGESAKDSLSCSGFYFGSGWILTHGTIVIDLLKEKLVWPLVEELRTNGCLINQRKSSLQAILDGTGSKFQVIFDESTYRRIHPASSIQKSPAKSSSAPSRSLQLQDLSNPGRVWDKSLQLPQVSSLETPSYFCHPAHLSMVFVQPGITKTLETMMPASEGWRLTEDKDGEDSSIDVEAIILSSFVLLKLATTDNKIDDLFSGVPAEELIQMIEKYITFTANVNKGANVYVESSPFGSLSPSVFLNSLSKGIISNVCGDGKDIYLTDARCVMGSEGAPVYTTIDKKASLVGIVISPFCWKRGEWLGLSLLATAKPVLLSLLHCMKLKDKGVGNPFETTEHASEWSAVQPMLRKVDSVSLEGIAEVLDNVVVGISCGGGWGSGIVVSSSPGIILTCAHVIQPASYGKVVVITSDGTRIHGQVIYHTHPSQQGSDNSENSGSSIWDIAVVETSSTLPKALPLATELPPKGSPVVVVGHGILTPNHFPSPNISHGIISKIVSIEASCLSYPATNGEKQMNGSSRIEDTFFGSEAVHDDIQHRRKGGNYCEKSCVAEPSLLKSDTIEKFDSNCEREEDLVKGAALLGGVQNGLVPVIFQTTCSVYAGNSGGPVVLCHPQHGLQVAGVMVCNTRDTANKATFPHINLAVPAPAIKKIISAYISSGDKVVLNYLGVECPTVSRLWALGLTPQSHL